MILIGYRSLSSPNKFLVSEILPSSKLDMYLATFSDLKDLIEILKCKLFLLKSLPCNDQDQMKVNNILNLMH